MKHSHHQKLLMADQEKRFDNGREDHDGPKRDNHKITVE